MDAGRLDPGDFDVVISRRGTSQTETVEQVLSDVYELLELYGPSWYNERLRERLQAALRHSAIHRESV